MGKQGTSRNPRRQGKGAKLRIDIVTLFPDFFTTPLAESILKRAQEKGLVKICLHRLRDYTHDRHQTVDGKPFGGGAGMVLKPEPIFECIETIRNSGWVVLLDARGEPLTQKMAEKLRRKRHLILIAGHYEGVDYRIHEHLVDQEISIGDFVTMGGEAPILCLVEAVVRLVPGVLGNRDSLTHESFHQGVLEYPQYTRPRKYRGWEVPKVLVSGNHQEVRRWRSEAARKLTRERRPDLLSRD
ncbi:MAG: tRNA (guanosine(37)-N1)-methyltransferase TrmD [Candidatus Omnitrophica bacterium]|nr:tRNA (guanosine(37)-N1)-methyltransferase TrmD [Candidatus Omnitrophota bacterium]